MGFCNGTTFGKDSGGPLSDVPPGLPTPPLPRSWISNVCTRAYQVRDSAHRKKSIRDCFTLSMVAFRIVNS